MTIPFDPQHQELAEVLGTLREALPDMIVSPAEFQKGNYMIDILPTDDDVVVLEKFVPEGVYGLSKNPELFCGHDRVITEKDVAVRAAITLAQETRDRT